MSGLVLAGGGELDPRTPAGRVLAGRNNVAVVTLAAAFRRPEAIREGIETWAATLGVRFGIVGAVHRAQALDPAVSAPIASADGVLVLDGSAAHLVSGLKATPLLEAIVSSRHRGATVVWSGAAASAACNPMVDDRGGALTVGLDVIAGVAAAAHWQSWPATKRQRLRRMLPEAATFFGLDEGAAVASAAAPNDPLNDTGTWRILGGSVEVRSSGQLVELPRATLSPKAARNGD